MLANNWKQNLHLEPTKGWLNDPNGLAYFKGKYHIFHQYFLRSGRWFKTFGITILVVT